MNSLTNTAAIAVLAAIIGGVGGAALTNARTAPVEAEKVSTTAQNAAPPTDASTALTQEQIDEVTLIAQQAAAEMLANQQVANTGSRYVARGRGRSAQRVYYDYAQPGSAPAAYTSTSKPSFWQRHRDILTVAIGTGIGTAIGAGVGGKKGALIGAGVGAGGSALYTYALRKRNPYPNY